MRIGLVSCAKTKLRGCHEARRLYVSALFQKAFIFAEITYDRVYILSAKHGLLRPDDRIRDYDVTLNHLSSNEQKRWSELVLRQLERRIASDDELFFLRRKISPTAHSAASRKTSLCRTTLGLMVNL